MATVTLRHVAGDTGTPVAALCAVAFVAESGHQRGPGIGDVLDPPAGSEWFVAETEPGHGRAYDMERIGRVSAVGYRIGERPDHLVELDDRSGPSVGEHQRQRIGVGRADVHEVDPEPVDLRAELREGVQMYLAGGPVVLLGPVRTQALEVGQRHTLGPVVHGLTLRPTSAGKPCTEIVEGTIRDLDAERSHFPCH